MHTFSGQINIGHCRYFNFYQKEETIRSIIKITLDVNL